MKPLLDRLLALILLPFVLLITIPVALMIKLEDGGPVFYRDERLGKHRKHFFMLKFRSMKVNAPDIRNEDGSTFNSSTDPRQTKIGRILRKTSIDELPQIFNILKGEMSFIGPRPSPLGNEDWYPKAFLKKFEVLPGVTGYNQALLRNSATFEERMKNDIYYTEHLSFLMDMKVLLLTVKTVFGGKNVHRNEGEKSIPEEKPRLVLLTNFYPFRKGEEYLDAEIPVLLERFPEIVLIPLMVGKKEKQTRVLPKRVQVLVPGHGHGKADRLLLFLGNALRALKNLKALGVEDKGRGKRFLYTWYFEARSLGVASSLIKLWKKSPYVGKSFHLYSYWFYLTARVGRELKRADSACLSFLSRAHRYDVDSEAAPLRFLPLRPFLLMSVDKVYTVCDTHKELLLRLYKEAEGKVEKARLGVKDSFGRREGEREHTSKHLIGISALRPVKRIPLLMEAFSLLRREEPDLIFHYDHYGISEEELTLSEELRSFVSLKGHLPHEELLNIMRDTPYDLFINVSSSEGIPVSGIEAAAASIPLLLTDAGGNRELLDMRSGKKVEEGMLRCANGILLKKSTSAELLKNALKRALREENISDLASSSRAVYEERFTLDEYRHFAEQLWKS